MIVFIIVPAIVFLLLFGWQGYKLGKTDGIALAKDASLVAILAAKSTAVELRAVAEHCRAQWEEWERKAEGYRSINSGILTERDTWQNLYREQSAAHGNAQAMMMSTIDHLAGKLKAAGIVVPIPPVIAQVHRDFIGTHVTPALPESATVYPQSAQAVEKVESKLQEPG